VRAPSRHTRSVTSPSPRSSARSTH
jgi:hypothetical protein